MRGVQFHHPVPAAVDGSEEVGKDYRHLSADLQVNTVQEFGFQGCKGNDKQG